ncbi:MAG TPA: penicillin acylase family protein [Candidatus Limnocylindria bacterium]|nr:penicillin acylase family protein [Candidatus Limnocylindria bacterium]
MRGLGRALGRVLELLLILVLVVAVLGSGLLAWLVVRGFPQREGSASLPGLSADVTVVRDAAGIPHIYAATSHDLFAAQGYAHASERMWQMEVWRRIGAGRLAELFGRSEVGTDRFIRTLGWQRAAQADLEVVSDAGRMALEAYAEGVNAWLDQHGDLPLPFVVAGLLGAGGGLGGFRPEPWTALDSLTWQKVQAWALGGNWEVEVFRLALAARGLSAEQIFELTPLYDGQRPVLVGGTPGFQTFVPPARAAAADEAKLGGLLELGDSLGARLGLGGAQGAGAFGGLGSNAWAVAPQNSASGGALLANDPHLGVSMPSLWFLVGLHCRPVGPQCPYELAGAGFPGGPGIVLGHNARIAWGLTNLGPDVQDLFVETLDPDSPSRYLHGGESLPFTTRQETISIAGGGEETVRIRSTVHGPLISDVADELGVREDDSPGLAEPGTAYSLAWSALAPGDRTFDAVLAINRAGNWEEFRAALRNFHAPAQAFAYADVDGHIGLQVAGRMPVRGAGDGSLPAPGADGSHDWTGWVPYDELPSVFDPPAGFIVAANNAPAGGGYAHFLGRDWDPGYRAMRLLELLDDAAPLTVDAMRELQRDTRLTRAKTVIEALEGVVPQTADGGVVMERIEAWRDDLSCEIQSQGCAAYEAFAYRLLRGVFDDELGGGGDALDMAARYVGSEPSHEALARLLSEPRSALWDDSTTPGVRETPARIMARALDLAGADLRHTLGDPAGWTWGRIHTVNFSEETFGRSGIGPLEAVFNRGPYPAPGSCTTVNKLCGPLSADYAAAGEGPADLRRVFAVTSHPSYRLVIDMSDLDAATVLQPTGQSGLPFDEHYGDLISRWLNNSPVRLPWTSESVELAGRRTLTLTP